MYALVFRSLKEQDECPEGTLHRAARAARIGRDGSFFTVVKDSYGNHNVGANLLISSLPFFLMGA